MRDKARNYFEYLSLYESSLYFNREFKARFDAAETVQISAKPHTPEGGLNPYPDYSSYPSLDAMNASVRGCLRCSLGSQRSNFVFGDGSPKARVVFIGEAPGQREDRMGVPFVGRAGELLNSMLEQIEWQRRDVYICNILKCRPPNNRDPDPEEISQCEPYLHEQLRILDPDWLVALGRVSAQVLLRTKAPLRVLRGSVHKYQDKPFWVTYHPAALLRNQNLMGDAHQDLLTLKRMVESGSGFEGSDL